MKATIAPGGVIVMDMENVSDQTSARVIADGLGTSVFMPLVQDKGTVVGGVFVSGLTNVYAGLDQQERTVVTVSRPIGDNSVFLVHFANLETVTF